MTSPPATAHHKPAPPRAPAQGKVARQGALSALPPDQQTTRPPARGGRYPVAWLTVTAPGRGTVPTATSVCGCGRNRSAVGHRKVAALVEEHTAHRTICPLLNRTEGRAAA
ncbi:hypothetical protein ACFYMO_20910 [Streptomyces sp. NPDC007025]|uniref:hypothetical protein n=1 Tax=Streptomyces sp. NPDC007025 TaxID=3364771 RepID=UPI0036C370EB